jgi:hypothetical protein
MEQDAIHIYRTLPRTRPFLDVVQTTQSAQRLITVALQRRVIHPRPALLASFDRYEARLSTCEIWNRVVYLLF